MANILICSVDTFREMSTIFEKLWSFWKFRDVLRVKKLFLSIERKYKEVEKFVLWKHNVSY